jgi:hypothetical protein
MASGRSPALVSHDQVDALNREHSPSFERLAGVQQLRCDLTIEGLRSSRTCTRITPDFSALLGIGLPIDASDEEGVVISDRLARELSRGRAAAPGTAMAVGRVVSLYVPHARALEPLGLLICAIVAPAAGVAASIGPFRTLTRTDLVAVMKAER